MDGIKELQSFLNELKPNFLQEFSEIFYSHKYIFDVKLLDFIIRDIFKLIKVRTDSAGKYATIILYIYNNVTSRIDAQQIPQMILFYSLLNKNSYRTRKIAEYKFLLECYKLSIISYDNLTRAANSATFSSYNYFLFFAMFASHIKRYDYLSFFYKIDKKFNKNPIYKSLEVKEFDVVNELIEYGYEKNSIGYILKFDMIEEFIALSSSAGFDYNQMIEISDFESYTPLEEKITLIKFAAFYGSVQCFKFLQLHGGDMKMDPTFEISITENSKILFGVSEFAIYGGSPEIIHLCEHNTATFKGTLGIAANSRRIEIFDWVMRTIGSLDTRNDHEYFRGLLCAASSNFIEGVESLAPLPFPDPPTTDECPLFSALESLSFEAALQLARLGLFWSPQCLAAAIEAGQEETALLLLRSGRFDASNGRRTAVMAASKYGSYEVARELVSRGPLPYEAVASAFDARNHDFLAAAAEADPTVADRPPKAPSPQCAIALVAVSICLLVLVFIKFSRLD